MKTVQILQRVKLSPVDPVPHTALDHLRDWLMEIKTPTNFAHTTGSGASFMQIDLGTATTVKKIVITNRLNCCQRRTENMKVKLLDANNTV
jgi:hypothetical protein